MLTHLKLNSQKITILRYRREFRVYYVWAALKAFRVCEPIQTVWKKLGNMHFPVVSIQWQSDSQRAPERPSLHLLSLAWLHLLASQVPLELLVSCFMEKTEMLLISHTHPVSPLSAPAQGWSFHLAPTLLFLSQTSEFKISYPWYLNRCKGFLCRNNTDSCLTSTCPCLISLLPRLHFSTHLLLFLYSTVNYIYSLKTIFIAYLLLCSKHTLLKSRIAYGFKMGSPCWPTEVQGLAPPFSCVASVNLPNR